jgi:hypothetical protein
LTLLATSLILPDVLYHGTTMDAILNPEGLQSKLINEKFMQTPRSENRDFGSGFYTTVDFRQASQWARKGLIAAWRSGIREFPEEKLPVILKIGCNLPIEERQIDVLDFRGESNKWSDFILLHRYHSRLNECYCRMVFGHDHPKIVCGPMADNDTGSVIALFKDENRAILNENDRFWFREEITHTEQGFRRYGLELGDQVAWFGEDLNNFLSFDGYYKINIDRFLADDVDEKNYREEWDYYEDN